MWKLSWTPGEQVTGNKSESKTKSKRDREWQRLRSYIEGNWETQPKKRSLWPQTHCSSVVVPTSPWCHLTWETRDEWKEHLKHSSPWRYHMEVDEQPYGSGWATCWALYESPVTESWVQKWLWFWAAKFWGYFFELRSFGVICFVETDIL